MADIPSPMTWGTVRGNFGALNADSSDAGLAPDLDVVQGTVTLTPRVPLVKILNPLNPMIAIAKTVNCSIINGVLIGPDGSPDVRVVASDSPGFEPAPLQWDVRIQITGASVQPAPMIIDVPGGKVVDLALVVPSPPAIPVVTVVTEETKIAAMVAASEAQASAQAAYGFSADAKNALTDSLAARVASIDARNAAQAASATAVTAQDTAVSSANSANTSKISAEASASTATTKASEAAESAARAAESANSTLPPEGTTEQFLRGDVTWSPLNKSAVGLPNVDDTSDAAKPVSTATQTELNKKVNSTSTLIPATEHTLDDYRSPGTYAQTTAGAATYARGYPVPSTIGVLTVNSGTTTQVVQRYQTISTGPTATPRIFSRSYFSSSWTPWAEDITTQNMASSTPVARVFFVDQGAYVAQVTLVDTGGRFIGGILGKEYAGSFENTGQTGANFKPVRAAIQDISPFGYPTIKSNSSGWRVAGGAGSTSENLGEIVGLQIRNGVLLHDFDNIGTASLGFKADGTSKIYYSASWTGAQVVAAGVINSYSFGPVLVDNGVASGLTGTERAGRTLLGQNSAGMIILVHIPGVSGVYGATFTECVAFMRSYWGAHNAIALDGGGSSQLMVGNTTAQPSSDAGGVRPIPDILTINARVDASVETQWRTLPLSAGITAGEVERLPQYRRVDGRIELRGRVFGTFTGQTYTPIGTLPAWLVSPRGGTTAGTGGGAVPGIITVAPNTVIVQVNPQTTTNWFDLSGFNYLQL